jgi:hypothetical protein
MGNGSTERVAACDGVTCNERDSEEPPTVDTADTDGRATDTAMEGRGAMSKVSSSGS